MKVKKSIVTVAMLSLLAVVVGCKHNAKNAWADVAKNCAYSDLNGKKILFFGVSNSIGPGSVWREATDGGGYRLRLDSSKIPGSSNWVKNGSEFDCQGSSSTKLSGGAVVDFASSVAPLSADLKTEFSKAKSVEVKVSKLNTVLIEEVGFEQAVKALPPASPEKDEMSKPGRLVMYRAILVSGFEAKLSFDTDVGAELSAKLKDGALQSINGELGAGVNVRWISNKELVLSSPNSFYIAGELAKFDTGGGFASASQSPSVETIDIQKNPSVEVENN
ncbi:hypothetical protein RHP75_02705 [Pseudomonas sp. SG20056]|uniref:hypothetical protein n=1 Tax=Pseudomonas sp. SG20056 TaxID=3074146 RepID=UPI00287F6ED9|nr:hypothetical protein [Pseudomonas sp. SG20056]WNF47371.1 hypothetical protein RHP75_02705 [Pseudomonas sp. SG20056]